MRRGRPEQTEPLQDVQGIPEIIFAQVVFFQRLPDPVSASDRPSDIVKNRHTLCRTSSHSRISSIENRSRSDPAGRLIGKGCKDNILQIIFIPFDSVAHQLCNSRHDQTQNARYRQFLCRRPLPRPEFHR